MDKQPVGQLPDLTQSNNDDEIMVITNSEYSQLKKEKISDFITDLQSTNTNNSLTTGSDGKLFVSKTINASDIDGVLSLDNIPQLSTNKLPETGISADNYTYPSSITVNDRGQVVSIVEGSAAEAGAYLDQSQITNCILEIPQNINLADNGTNIIIKAGTIGIKPNGFEADGSTPKFDYITVTADITLENNQTATVMLGLNGAQNVYRTPIGRCFSGLVAPESPVNLTIWYDTSTNLVKRYVNSAWSVENFTLPLGILNYTASGTPGSTQQVFNGFGYIGSTLWIDKGVRMLIPNYRNDDGTLKNQDFTTEKIYLTYFASNYTRVNGKLVFVPSNISNNIHIWAGPEYDSAKNIMVSIAEEYSMIILSVGGNTVENGVIQSLNIPQTVSLAKNNEVVHVTGNETIGGQKTFTDQVIIKPNNSLAPLNIHSNIDAISSFVLNNFNLTDPTPTSNKQYSAVNLFDNAIRNILRVAHQKMSNGNNTAFLEAGQYRNNAMHYSSMHVGFDANGNFWSFAPNVTNAGGIVTQAALYKSANGYLKLGNGIIIQWGFLATKSTTTTITFPTAFTTTNYSVTFTALNHISTNQTDANEYGHWVRSRTTSSCVIVDWLFSQPNNTGVLWFAIGY